MKHFGSYVCIILSFVGIAAGSMPESFRHTITANYKNMEQFLLEDTKVDANRHCDWILMRGSELFGMEGKLFQ